MKKVKHIIFWLVVIGVILLLFSSHVIAGDIFQHALADIIKADRVASRNVKL